ATASELQTAFECLEEIYDLASNNDDSLFEMDYGGARIDRWFAGTLNRIWQSGDAETRTWISQRVESLKTKPKTAPEIVELASKARFVRYFGGLPSQGEMLLDLADAHQAAGQRREAE